MMTRAIQSLILIAALVVGYLVIQSSDRTGSETSELKPVTNDGFASSMLLQIESEIAAQEDRQDVRCWSSVSKIQMFLSGMPIDSEAISQRVERYILLIDDIWRSAADKTSQKQIDDVTLLAILQERFPHQIDPSNQQTKFTFPDEDELVLVMHDAVEDYDDTIESWRLLHSWASRKSLEGKSDSECEFSPASLKTFRDFLVVFDIALMKKSKQVAMDAKVATIDASSMDTAFDLMAQNLGDK